jgi:hypothetical protein
MTVRSGLLSGVQVMVFGKHIIHHVLGLYRWSKTCYFEFFVVLFNPFWYYCKLFPCYSTVVPYYRPLLQPSVIAIVAFQNLRQILAFRLFQKRP